jgi:hypothetical protein
MPTFGLFWSLNVVLSAFVVLSEDATFNDSVTHLANAGWNPRYGFESVFFNNSILMFGGVEASVKGSEEATNDIWRSTNQGQSWQKVPSVGRRWSQRGYHKVVVWEDNTLVLMGGIGNGSPLIPAEPLADVWLSNDGGGTNRRIPSLFSRNS